MKSVIITFNQAYYEEIVDIMDHLMIRGYTYWDQVRGRGSKNGAPRMGSHSWPEMNSVILAVMEDEKVDGFLEQLKALDRTREVMGLRAFVSPVEKSI